MILHYVRLVDASGLESEASTPNPVYRLTLHRAERVFNQGGAAAKTEDITTRIGLGDMERDAKRLLTEIYPRVIGGRDDLGAAQQVDAKRALIPHAVVTLREALDQDMQMSRLAGRGL